MNAPAPIIAVPAGANARAESLADNVYFRLLSRGSMILLTTVFVPLTLAILLRTYDTVTEVREAQIRDTTRLERALGDVADLQRDRWTSFDAARDRADADRRFAALEASDARLENRIETLKSSGRGAR